MLELFKRLHKDERGSLSLETILIITAIAIPIILFIYKIGWPKIREMFDTSMDVLINDSSDIYSD
jgi:Flp pilus assembly pilin Flp